MTIKWPENVLEKWLYLFFLDPKLKLFPARMIRIMTQTKLILSANISAILLGVWKKNLCHFVIKIPSLPRKTNQTSHRDPPLFCPQNSNFVIVMQFLAILPKMSLHQSTPNGKTWWIRYLLKNCWEN